MRVCSVDDDVNENGLIVDILCLSTFVSGCTPYTKMKEGQNKSYRYVPIFTLPLHPLDNGNHSIQELEGFPSLN
jgi:hypothetical protein